jgi:uncharacterized protein (DUF488 family)
MIYTVGHSTRTADAFLALLRAHGIQLVADVRTVPRSRRHPQFTREALEDFLHVHGIDYEHYAALGGLRKPRRDSVNTGWRHPAFRGYADHMESEQFQRALEQLARAAAARTTAVMCAEAVWWQCHRKLLADALLVAGVPVRHIMSETEAKPHELSEFARASDGRVTYPGFL